MSWMPEWYRMTMKKDREETDGANSVYLERIKFVSFVFCKRVMILK